MKQNKQYEGNNLSNLVIIVLVLAVMSAFVSCKTTQSSFNNSGEACHKYFHKEFKKFKS